MSLEEEQELKLQEERERFKKSRSELIGVRHFSDESSKKLEFKKLVQAFTAIISLVVLLQKCFEPTHEKVIYIPVAQSKSSDLISIPHGTAEPLHMAHGQSTTWTQ